MTESITLDIGTTEGIRKEWNGQQQNEALDSFETWVKPIDQMRTSLH
jgi:hypothetical protein